MPLPVLQQPMFHSTVHLITRLPIIPQH